MKQNQPIFSISTHVEQDLDDGKYGTEVITIRNVGQTTSQPCKVENKALIKLTKSFEGNRDSLYFQIEDYFNVASNGNTGDNEVYYAKGCGSNRKYSELYFSSLEANKAIKPHCYYFVDKVLLTKIEYTDIYNKDHVRYFMDKTEISHDVYDSILLQCYDDYRFSSLMNLSFPAMKEVIDNLKK
jgi:hypothetical protein